MRVLVFAQYFPPEIGAGENRVHAFAAGLAARGHEVEVICEVPNRPTGIVQPGYRGRPVHRRRLDGFNVRYVWVAASQTKTLARRVGLYGTYVAGAAAVGMGARRPQVIFASSPPLPVGVPAAVCARRHRVPWVFDVRDLWPEAAVAMGELSNPRMVELADRLARTLYRDATAITTVTEPFRRAIAAKSPDGQRISLLPNGTTNLWIEAAGLEPDRAALGLPEDESVWTYVGNMSAAQGLAAAVEAAGMLGAGFRLFMFGDGPLRGQLEAQAAELPQAQVSFPGELEPRRAAERARASDALLVPLAPRPELADFVPSKLYDYCAAGRPVIVAAAGEPTRLAAESGAALAVPPGDPAALAEAVRRLRDDTALRERLATAGHAFGAANVRERQVERLGELLQGLVASDGG